MEKFIDYYELLGVSKNASIEEIKSNYHKLVKIHHTDGECPDEEKIRLLNIAYEVLSNPKKRSDYDLLYECDSQENNFNGKSMEDLFNDLSKAKQDVLERMALKKSYEEKVEEIEVFIDKKNQFLADAYAWKYSERAYQKQLKRLYNEFRELRSFLCELSKEAVKQDFITMSSLIESSINYLDISIKDIPSNLTDLIVTTNHDEAKKMFISKYYSTIDDYVYAIDQLKELGFSLARNEVSREEYEDLRTKINLSIQENYNLLKQKEFMDKVFEFITISEQTEIDKKIKLLVNYFQVLDIFVTNYELAVIRCNLFLEIESLGLKITELDEIGLKNIQRIKLLLDKYPKSHHYEYLYNKVIEYIDDIITKLTDFMRSNSQMQVSDYNTDEDDRFKKTLSGWLLDYWYYMGTSMDRQKNLFVVPLITDERIHNTLFNIKGDFEGDYEPIKITKKREYNISSLFTKSEDIFEAISQLKFRRIKTYNDFKIMYYITKYHAVTDLVLFLAVEGLLFGHCSSSLSVSKAMQTDRDILNGLLFILGTAGNVLFSFMRFVYNTGYYNAMKLDAKTDKFLRRLIKDDSNK